MFNKLNGWQRLWVVVSVTLFIGFAVYATSKFPTQFAVYPEECKKIAIDVEKELHELHKSYPNPRPRYMLPGEFFDPDAPDSDPRFIACREKVILKEKIVFVVKIFVVWLATIVFIYGAGYSVAWIRRGFHQKKG